MNENPILEEIWRIREEIARESNYDPHAMAEAARQREARLAAEGWKLVPLADAAAHHSETCVVREDPPKP